MDIGYLSPAPLLTFLECLCLILLSEVCFLLKLIGKYFFFL
jgi:hypothetical protein